LNRLALLVEDDDGRTQFGCVLAARTAIVHHHLGRHAGLFVRHFAQRDAEDQVLILHGAFDVGQNRQGVGVPFREAVAALHGRALVHLQARAIGDAIGGPFLALIVGDHDLHVAAHRDQFAIGILDDVAVRDLDLAVI